MDAPRVDSGTCTCREGASVAAAVVPRDVHLCSSASVPIGRHAHALSAFSPHTALTVVCTWPAPRRGNAT